MASLVTDLARFLDEVGAEPFEVGWSDCAGMVARWLARRGCPAATTILPIRGDGAVAARLIRRSKSVWGGAGSVHWKPKICRESSASLPSLVQHGPSIAARSSPPLVQCAVKRGAAVWITRPRPASPSSIVQSVFFMRKVSLWRLEKRELGRFAGTRPVRDGRAR